MRKQVLTNQRQFRCPFPGCNIPPMGIGQDQFRRHLESYHIQTRPGGQQGFSCPFPNCDGVKRLKNGSYSNGTSLFLDHLMVNHGDHI
ncbi:hypothetical protein EJ08DRAFT_649255 [Tothia fuscella]|uniref:C2H2-type domain-containing protein n=1 Tax=Tothia fuscella TaxID=1048955 RepID=A0A9P4NSK5_9PEZI|nr:hypothetical protein EJ08DRAFT_649255 [Tothia fuscella]